MADDVNTLDLAANDPAEFFRRIYGRPPALQNSDVARSALGIPPITPTAPTTQSLIQTARMPVVPTVPYVPEMRQVAGSAQPVASMTSPGPLEREATPSGGTPVVFPGTFRLRNPADINKEGVSLADLEQISSAPNQLLTRSQADALESDQSLKALLKKAQEQNGPLSADAIGNLSRAATEHQRFTSDVQERDRDRVSRSIQQDVAQHLQNNPDATTQDAYKAIARQRGWTVQQVQEAHTIGRLPGATSPVATGQEGPRNLSETMNRDWRDVQRTAGSVVSQDRNGHQTRSVDLSKPDEVHKAVLDFLSRQPSNANPEQVVEHLKNAVGQDNLRTSITTLMGRAISAWSNRDKVEAAQYLRRLGVNLPPQIAPQ